MFGAHIKLLLYLTLLSHFNALLICNFSQFIHRYCLDSERRLNGMLALRDIVIYHPLQRAQAFQMLLDFSSSEQEQVRSTAIRCVEGYGMGYVNGCETVVCQRVCQVGEDCIKG